MKSITRNWSHRLRQRAYDVHSISSLYEVSVYGHDLEIA
jgi:hypothetical protein